MKSSGPSGSTGNAGAPLRVVGGADVVMPVPDPGAGKAPVRRRTGGSVSFMIGGRMECTIDVAGKTSYRFVR